MKRLSLYFILCLVPFLSNAQITRKVRKVVPILTQQSFYLNGDFKPAPGSSARANYKIDLPANTTEWYYALTVCRGTASEQPVLNLVQQLEKQLEGSSNINVNSIMIPAGTHPCFIYLMTKPNAESFQQKADQSGGGFAYIPSGTRENINNTVVQIKDAIYGTFWLGFKDPGGVGGITIHLDVAAITEMNMTNNSEWSKEITDNLTAFFYENVKGKIMGETEARDIAGCMIGQLINNKTPGDYYGMSQAEKDSFLATTYRICAVKYEEPRGPNYDKASNLANLAWIQYERGNLDSALALNKMSLTLDSSLAMVKANLGLIYLIRNDAVTANNYYVQALEGVRRLKLSYRKTEHVEAMIRNLQDAMKKYPGLKSEEVMEMLK